MLKAVKGIYEKGKIRLPLDEIPEEYAEIKVIVVFLEPNSETHLTEGDPLEDLEDIDINAAPEKESHRKESMFSVKKSKFFSLPSEHLGDTSANEIDRILSEEALGHR